VYSLKERRYLWILLPASVALAISVDIIIVSALGVGGFPTPGQVDTPVPSAIPLGTAISVETPSEASSGPNHWYNFTVTDVADGIEYGEFTVQVVNALTFSPVGTGPFWTFVAQNGSSELVAQYSFSGGAWVTGGTFLVSAGETLVLDAVQGPGLHGAGDALQLSAVGVEFTGSVVAGIP
jgi:hypothetical protein